MTSKARPLIAMFGALVYALVGLRIFLSSLASLMVSIRGATQAGSGGAGFFAVDVIVVPFFLLLIASVIANRMLTRWVSASSQSIRMLHRAQSVSLVLAVAVPVAATVIAEPLGLQLLLLSGGILGTSFVLTAALLGMYALRASSGSR